MATYIENISTMILFVNGWKENWVVKHSHSSFCWTYWSMRSKWLPRQYHMFQWNVCVCCRTLISSFHSRSKCNSTMYPTWQPPGNSVNLFCDSITDIFILGKPRNLPGVPSTSGNVLKIKRQGCVIQYNTIQYNTIYVT